MSFFTRVKNSKSLKKDATDLQVQLEAAYIALAVAIQHLNAQGEPLILTLNDFKKYTEKPPEILFSEAKDGTVTLTLEQ